MRARALGCAAALAAALSAAPGLAAQDQAAPLLRAQFWIEREPVSAAGDPWPLSVEEAAHRLLEEAIWVYGGMVWGFGFEYAPLDRARGIAELFRLSPLGSIAWGDPRLRPGPLEPSVSRRLPEGELGPLSEMCAYVEYRPDGSQALLMESYGREPWERAQGIGKAELRKGWPGRRAAYEDSLREAVRAYLRSIEPNKPRRATGRVVFESVPSITVREGFYLVRAKARVELLELQPYVVY